MNRYNVWLVDDRLFIAYYDGEITTQTLLDGQAEVKEILANPPVDAPIHIIVDMRFLLRYPTNISDLIRATPIFRSPALGWVVLVSNDWLIRFLSSTVVQLSKAHFRAFANVQSALDFLHQTDPSIPQLRDADYEDAIDRLKKNRLKY